MTPAALAEQAVLLLRDMPHGDETATTLTPAVPSIHVTVSGWLDHDGVMEVLAHLTDRVVVDSDEGGLMVGRFDGVHVLVTYPVRRTAAS